jgi:chromosome segregation ATPase
MHRLPLILCAIALLGSTLSTVLYFQIGNSKQLLVQRLDDAHHRTTKLETDLASANEQTGTLKAKVAATSAELEVANTKLTAAEARAGQLDRDLTQTRSVLSVYEQTTRALSDEMTALRQDLADARGSNASPEAVAAYKSTIAELERQLASAHNGAVAPGTLASSNAVFTSRSGRALVMTVGPENAFVVLNFGAARGARLGQKLNVNQGTDVVATVLISDVRPNFSVAQVLPETLRGVLQRGDSAVLLR